jgi:hypothetical protein
MTDFFVICPMCKTQTMSIHLISKIMSCWSCRLTLEITEKPIYLDAFCQCKDPKPKFNDPVCYECKKIVKPKVAEKVPRMGRA